MGDIPGKKVDESWKERVEREKQHDVPGPAAPSTGGPAHAKEDELPEARFDLFISGLAMDALIALGDMPHPTTRKQSMNLTQAKYLIDVLGILADKTKGNLTAEEDRLLKDALYQLRMRYMAKAKAA